MDEAKTSVTTVERNKEKMKKTVWICLGRTIPSEEGRSSKPLAMESIL